MPFVNIIYDRNNKINVMFVAGGQCQSNWGISFHKRGEFLRMSRKGVKGGGGNYSWVLFQPTFLKLLASINLLVSF